MRKERVATPTYGHWMRKDLHDWLFYYHRVFGDARNKSRWVINNRIIHVEGPEDA